MPRRGEHIHKRKDGRWEARYKSRVAENGKAVYKSIYARTYAEVKEKLRTYIGQHGQKGTALKDITFGDALVAWQEANKFRHKGATSMKYANLMTKHILPELKEVRLSQINTVFLSAFMNRKLELGRLDGKGGLSPTYVRSIMRLISSVIDFSVAEHLCPPMKMNLRLPETQKKELAILNAQDQKRLETLLLSNLNETAMGMYLSLQTGLRIGEVCALRWSDVDLSAAVIHIRATIARVRCGATGGEMQTKLIRDTPKTRASTRDIPISSNVMKALKSVFDGRTSEYVVSQRGSFVSPRTFEYRFRRTLEKSGIPYINFHALRHTFATRCVEAGVDIKTLSEILGHSNVAVTLNTYVHSSMERKREQLEKLSWSSL